MPCLHRLFSIPLQIQSFTDHLSLFLIKDYGYPTILPGLSSASSASPVNCACIPILENLEVKPGSMTAQMLLMPLTLCSTWPLYLCQEQFLFPFIPVNQSFCPCLHKKREKSILLQPRKQFISHPLQSPLLLIQKGLHILFTDGIANSFLPLAIAWPTLSCKSHHSLASLHIDENDNSCWGGITKQKVQRSKIWNEWMRLLHLTFFYCT